MSFFESEGLHNIEGVDTFNACYGGTNALFNTTNWMSSEVWNGYHGVVLCSDPAVHPDPALIAGIGASSICLLIASRASLPI
jgi:hydroxymethylglutaryl-CoA synthase